MFISILGTPTDVVQTPAFANFFVTKIEPESENWFLDTTGGIVVVCLLTILLVAAVCVLIWAIYAGKLGKAWNCDGCRSEKCHTCAR